MKEQPIFHDPPPPFQLLLKAECWGVAAGAGSMASFHFGRKLLRSRPINNAELAPDLRTHQGEVILFIECKWSVSLKSKTLFDTEDDACTDEDLTKALRRLIGKSCAQIGYTFPPTVVWIAFDNGARLNLETDMPDSDDPHDNFTLSVSDKSFIIGPDRALRVEPRRDVSNTLGYEITPRAGLGIRSEEPARTG